MMIVIISNNKSILLDYKVQKWAKNGNFSVYLTFYQNPVYINSKIIYCRSEYIYIITTYTILLSILLLNTLFSSVIGN